MRFCLAAISTTLAAFLLIGCAAAPPSVEQIGAMRDVMRDGRTEARIGLADAVAQPHAVAIGALEGLAGEITILHGDVWVSRVVKDGLRVTGPELVDGDEATLLTLTHVARWQSLPVMETVEGRELESLIEQSARARGIDTSKPFPFQLEGPVASIDFHVINGFCPFGTDAATIDAQPWRWSNTRSTDVIIVGFFAADAAGVMTHHGTSIHAHVILSIDGRMITGHVDEVSTAPGMTLRVPAVD